MTPKEKAKEILDRIDYEVNGDINDRNKVDIALYFVSEIIPNIMDEFGEHEGTCFGIDNYWEEVEKEINKVGNNKS